MNTTKVRRARTSEAATVSGLALRSKGHWGYSPAQMAIFRSELTLTAEDITPHRAHILESNEQIIGFYTLVPRDPNEVELEHLFVEPGALGQGHGRLLFMHACQLARDEGFARMFIESDPNAAGFYLALGAILEREIPSSIEGRTLPAFSFDLLA